MRRAFYALSVQFAEAEANRKGLVTILYFVGSTTKPAVISEAGWKLPKVNEGLPMRVAAIHMCYDTRHWTPVHSIIKLAFNTFAKVRVRTHYGKTCSVGALFVFPFSFQSHHFCIQWYTYCRIPRRMPGQPQKSRY